MNAHTKGPWKVAEGKKTDELFIEASTRKGGRIARLWNGRSGRNANADLIAAAPDMLEMLQNASILLKVKCRGDDVGMLQIEKIDAIIAKAKGEL